MQQSRKRLFISLLMFSLLALVLISIFAWWLVSQQNFFINQIILTSVVVVMVIAFFLIGGSIVALVFSIWRSTSNHSLNKITRKVSKFLFPIALQIGKWFGLEKDTIKNSYIQVSNQLVELENNKVAPENILILAPHCLQRVECNHKISVNVNNCKQCGLCPVGDLLTLSKEKNVQLVVATGGTFARKFIRERRPQAIVAIACERDLTSGIQDVEKIPVIGVVNERPEGPCHNTRVNLCAVERAIDKLTLKGYKVMFFDPTMVLLIPGFNTNMYVKVVQATYHKYGSSGEEDIWVQVAEES